MEESGVSTEKDGASPADGDVKPDPMETDAADAETTDATPKEEATETAKAEVDPDAVTDTPAVDGEGGTKDGDGDGEADGEKGGGEGKDGPGSPASVGDEPPSKKAKVGSALLVPRVLLFASFLVFLLNQVELVSCAVMPSSPSVVSVHFLSSCVLFLRLVEPIMISEGGLR